MATLNPLDVARAIRAIDYIRWPSPALPLPSSHKEWHHFLIHDGRCMCLVNFSLSEEHDPLSGRERSVGRLKVLEYDGEFLGGVSVFDDEQIRVCAGRIDVRFGPNLIAFTGGRYELSLALDGGNTSIELTLVPDSMPLLTSNLALAPGQAMSWLAVPRLRAWGAIRRRGVARSFAGAPAYHDHNWGHFRWGDDFTWEWGTAIPDPGCELSFNLVRITDRARSRVLLQSLYVWHGPTLWRIFRDRELEWSYRGRPRPHRIFKIPQVMALIHPDTAADVPCELRITGRSDGDCVQAVLELGAFAQIIMPNEREHGGVTSLNQCVMRGRLFAEIESHRVEMEAPCVFEFIRG